MMRPKMIAGNWKMNLSKTEAIDLSTSIISQLKQLKTDVTVVLAPSFVYLTEVISVIKGNSNVNIAAQNCSASVSGAFTGEISASMLKSLGVNYVIVGHSERRKLFHESNEMITQKIDRVFEQGMSVIFCCGEDKDERESGIHFSVVQKQITDSLFHLDENQIIKVIIAYEPVWAIGTGLNATPDQAQEMHHFIRELISKKFGASLAVQFKILYGGSCNAKNGKALFAMPDVDGSLVGGASLKANEFIEIINSAS